MVGGALLSLGVVGVDRRHLDDAERLQAVLQYLRDRAELEGREYGIAIDRDGYRVYRFEPRQRRWIDSSEATMRARRWRDESPIELRLDGRLVKLPVSPDALPETARREVQPQLGVDAVGEYTPFAIRFLGPPDSETVELAPDENGELRLSIEARQ